MHTTRLLAPRRLVVVATLLLAAVPLAACGTGPAPDVVDASDAAADAPPADAPLDASPDANPDGGLDAAPDAPPDAGADADDAGRVSFTSSVHANTLMQNCMPMVAPDPLRFDGTLDILNTGTLPVGPVMATDAVVTSAEGAMLARFSIEPVTLPVVPAGMMGSVMITKRADTLMPAMGCSAIPCGTLARVRLSISGPNVPPGTFANSPLTTVMCAF